MVANADKCYLRTSNSGEASVTIESEIIKNSKNCV